MTDKEIDQLVVSPESKKVLKIYDRFEFSFLIFFLSHFLNSQEAGSPSLSYSFNIADYLNDQEISYSLPVQSSSSEKSLDRLKDILSYLGNLTDLIQNAETVSTIITDLQDILPLSFRDSFISMANIEDQLPRIKKAQKNLAQKTLLLEKRSINKEKAHDLHISIDSLKATSQQIQPELKALHARKIALEKELAEVNSAISQKEAILNPIPGSIIEKKKEMTAVVSKGKQLSKNLKTISESSKDDEQLMAHVESVRVNVLNVINNLFSL